MLSLIAGKSWDCPILKLFSSCIYQIYDTVIDIPGHVYTEIYWVYNIYICWAIQNFKRYIPGAIYLIYHIHGIFHDGIYMDFQVYLSE